MPSVGEVEDLMFFDRWLKNQPYTYKVVIAGNHDFIFEKDPVLSKKILKNAIYLQDSGVDIQGLKFWRMPWIPLFFNWAFMRKENHLKEITDQIPPDTEVLISHGPPYGILDRVLGKHVGCRNLLEAVQRVKPTFHIFGHIHEGYGSVSLNGTTFINACTLNRFYEAVNRPFDFEIGSKQDG